MSGIKPAERTHAAPPAQRQRQRQRQKRSLTGGTTARLASVAALVACSMQMTSTPALADASEPMPFSFAELWAAPPLQPAALQTFTASDGEWLAYRVYLPARAPSAVLVFYHGAGLHSGAGYQYLGRQLSEKYGIAVFMPDVRGHGESGGARGDAPDTAQIWRDVASMLERVRSQFRGVPLYLGGHSAGSALVLNYMANFSDNSVDGLALLAPSLGPAAGTDRASEVPFAVPNSAVFIAHTLTGGTLFGHSRAIELKYPASVLARDNKLLSGYSANMAWSIVPRVPGELRPASADALRQQLGKLKSFGLWIGSDDEVFDAVRVTALANGAGEPGRHSVELIPAVNHMSILIDAGDLIGLWLQRRMALAGNTGGAIAVQ